MVSDPIADMLTRIRNASMVQHRQVRIPSSVIKVAIAKILLEEGFVANYTVTDEKPQPKLILALKYTGKGKSVITGLQRVSKPGLRTYVGYREIPWVRSGPWHQYSVNAERFDEQEQARCAEVGGEVLCNIW